MWMRLASPRQGGAKTSNNPTDKGKKGTMRHVAADRNGILLSVIDSAGNVHGSKLLEEAVDGIEPIRKPFWRPTAQAAQEAARLHKGASSLDAAGL